MQLIKFLAVGAIFLSISASAEDCYKVWLCDRVKTKEALHHNLQGAGFLISEINRGRLHEISSKEIVSVKDKKDGATWRFHTATITSSKELDAFLERYCSAQSYRPPKGKQETSVAGLILIPKDEDFSTLVVVPQTITAGPDDNLRTVLYTTMFPDIFRAQLGNNVDEDARRMLEDSVINRAFIKQYQAARVKAKKIRQQDLEQGHKILEATQQARKKQQEPEQKVINNKSSL